MKIKKWLSLPIIVGGLLAFVPYNYFSHHHKTTPPPALKAYTMSYDKYLQKMHARKSLANTNPMQLSAIQSDPPLLGYGYDLTNGTFSKKNAFSNIDNVGVKIVPLDSSYSFESITSQNQLNSDLGVDGSMSFGFKHFALSGAASFQHQVMSSTSDIHISFRMKTDVIELFDYNNKAQLSDKAKSLVDSKNTKTFFDEYDAKYVTKIYATREVLFNLNIQLDSSVSKTDVKAKINFKKGLLSLAGAFNLAMGNSNNNSKITMSTLSLPGNRVIYPDDKVNDPSNPSAPIISGTPSQRSAFLEDMQNQAVKYVNFDNNPSNKSDPSQYFAKGINEKQLDSYSYYYDPAANVVNPNAEMLKEFPQLNQYYDLYENMSQDLKKAYSYNFNLLFINKLKYYNNISERSFENYNLNFIMLFKNHNSKPLFNECKNWNNIFFKNIDFVHQLKTLDLIINIKYINILIKKSEYNPMQYINFKDLTFQNVFDNIVTFRSDKILNVCGILSGYGFIKINFFDKIRLFSSLIPVTTFKFNCNNTKKNNLKKFLILNEPSLPVSGFNGILNMLIDYSSSLNPDMIINHSTYSDLTPLTPTT